MCRGKIPEKVKRFIKQKIEMKYVPLLSIQSLISKALSKQEVPNVSFGMLVF